MHKSKDLINDIKGEQNFSFEVLYNEYYGLIQNFVLKNNGTKQDAEDLFQDVMIVFVEKLRYDNFTLTASLKTYIYAISKNLWYKKIRKNNVNVEFNETYNESFFEEIQLSIDNEKSYAEKLQLYLTKITDHCSRLLKDMFFKDKSIEQIQEDYGYTSKHNLQNQKYKCVQQVKKIKEKEEKNNLDG